MIHKFPTDDGQWASVLEETNARWRKWLASEPQSTEGQLIFGPKPDAIDATSPSGLMEELTR
jgi:hypothetical protein